MIPSTATRCLARQVVSISQRSYVAHIRTDELSIVETQHPKPKTPYEDLKFGKTFTDHMLEIDWNVDRGWDKPKIIPFQNLSLSPAATGLHYGIQCFEGMKAYKDSKGKVRLFRPDKNIERLNNSMTRLSMPSITGDHGFLDCLKALIRLDESWVPDKEGYSLYIRPTAIGTSPILGVHASEDVKLYVILSPVGPYYPSGFKPVKLFADSVNVRAWPGGVGNTKVGGNYAPTIFPSQIAAKKHGANQILWLYGPNHECTEVGAMNIFFVFKDQTTGRPEIATAPLTRGDILPGVTRDSILALTRKWPGVTVSERFVTMGEIKEAQKNGTLLEAFGAGTAAVVSPVRCIVYEGEEIHIPTGDHAGPVAQQLWNELTEIQYGKIDHPWSVPVDSHSSHHKHHNTHKH